jgi:protein-disulfide isomerase
MTCRSFTWIYRDRFWEFHDLAYENQSRLDHDSVRQFAGQLELDGKAFAACLSDGTGNARVAGAEREARRLGLRGTPSVYVNGQPLRSDHLERDLERIIEEIVASG